MLKKLYVVHKWAGLAVALLFLGQATTGMMLAFKDELRALDRSGAFRVAAEGQRADLDSIVGAVKRHAPGWRLERLIAPVGETQVFLARLVSENGQRRFLTIDPYTLAPTAFGGYAAFPLEAALFFHYNLLLGPVGRVIVGLQGILLLAMTVTGLVLWWPRGGLFLKSLKIAWTAPYPRLIFDLHRVPAAFASVLLMVLAFTGAMISFRAELTALLPAPPALASGASVAGTAVSIEDARNRAAAAVGNAPLKDIRFSAQEPHVVRFVFHVDKTLNPRDAHQVWADLERGGVTKIYPAKARTAKDRFFDWMLPIHTLEFLGMTGRIVAFLLGPTLIAMTVTGLLLWLKRRRVRARRKAPAA